MRLLPILTALCVCAGLVLLVLWRDEVQNFAASFAPTPAPTTEAADGGAAIGAAETQVRPTATGTAEAGATAATGATAGTEPDTGGGGTDTATTPDAAAQAGDRSRRVRVVVRRSEAQAVDNAVRLRGRTEASRMVEVRAETAGRIISEPIRAGATVTRGQVLCEIDPGTRAAALSEAEAALAEARARLPEARGREAEARARLISAEIEMNAASRLSEGGFASETRVASAEAAVAAAEAAIQSAEAGVEGAQSAIQSAEASVARAEEELQRLIIRAPFDGMLNSDTAELGALMQTGGACATILQLDPMTLVGFLPEAEVAAVEPQAQAAARIATGQQVQGEVTFLSRSSDPATRTFRVEIEVDNSDLALRDGQSAEILIQTGGLRAHTLPASALTLNDDGDLGVRYVGEGDVARFARVQLLRDTPDGAIVTGLPQALDVIVVGQEYVSDGVAIDPVPAGEVSQ